MPSNGIRYVYCDIYASNCTHGPGDYIINGTYQNAWNTAFSNWTGHKTNNNSGIGFYEASDNSIPYYTIEILRVTNISIPNAVATMQANMWPTDSSGDNVTDTCRVRSARIDIKSSVNGGIFGIWVMAHEIGHTMGLADCYLCGMYTTVMTSETFVLNSTDTSIPQTPTTCDNQQVAAVGF